MSLTIAAFHPLFLYLADFSISEPRTLKEGWLFFFYLQGEANCRSTVFDWTNGICRCAALVLVPFHGTLARKKKSCKQ